MSLEITTQNNQQSSMNPDVMNMLMQYTNMFAEASIVPDHYRGKKGDIFISVQTAHRLNLDPMSVMQGTYVIHGKLGMTSAFAISLANTSGLLKGGITYKVEGSDSELRVTAKATLKASGEEISYTIGMKEAKAEGWTDKKGSKYKTMPELMLRYRAATLLIRTHIPQVLNGMRMTEELEDIGVSTQSVKLKDVSTEKEPTNKLDSHLEEEEVVVETLEAAQEIADEPNFTKKATLLSEMIEHHQVPQEVVDSWIKKAQVEDISQMKEEYIDACIDYVENKKHLENKN